MKSQASILSIWGPGFPQWTANHTMGKEHEIRGDGAGSKLRMEVTKAWAKLLNASSFKIVSIIL